MKHILRSNLYLIFWTEKFFDIAMIAVMIVLVLVLQGHFSAYVIGIYLTTFMSLLKLNTMNSKNKYEKIIASMPEKKEDIITSRFTTAGVIIGMITIVNFLVSVWGNTKEVIYEGGKLDYSLREVIINISTPWDDLWAGLIFGMLLALICSSVYIYLWSKYESDKYNLYSAMLVIISLFAIPPVLKGIEELGISMIAVNAVCFIIAVPAVYLSFRLSKKAYSDREF